ncbi:NERD domain-containing protein [Streptomyces sp. NBC_01465]
MADLKVQEWKRYGQHRWYVNLPDGSSVAWADCATGKVTVLVEEHRREALALLRPLLTNREPSRPRPVAAPPRSRRPSTPRLPALTPPDDLALNRPGAALQGMLAEKGPTPGQRLLGWLLRRESEWEPWRKGLAGERRVGDELQRLHRSGWRVLHSVPLSRGGDIDHLLIGPGGVFSINSKNHQGKTVWVGDTMAEVNHGKPQPYAVKSRAEAQHVREVLERHCGFAVAVEPVLVFVGVTSLDRAATQFAVRIYKEREVAALGPLTGVLTPEQIEAVYAVARHRQVWLGA